MNFLPSAAVERVDRTSARPAMAPAPVGAISLAMGEPDFATPTEIVEAACDALHSGATHYTDQNGDPVFRDAVLDDIRSSTGVSFRRDDVFVTHGATAGLAAAIFGSVGPGDRVVIPEPCYSLYPDLVRLAGAEPVLIAAQADLHWDLERLGAALAGARAVVFSNPCNPTGVVHALHELEYLGQALHGTDTLVIADEAYDSLIYAPSQFHSALSLESLRERTLYCQTLSKTFAMTGWRLGYLAGPTDVIKAAGRVHRTFNGSINTAVQRAGTVALNRGRGLAAPMLDAYKQRREVIVEGLRAVPGLDVPTPEGAFYAFPRYAVDLPSANVTAALKAAGVLVRAGSEYGPSGEGRLRLSFAASPEDITEAISRMQACLEDLASSR